MLNFFPTLSLCCDDAALPWFTQQFLAARQEDVESRICHDQSTRDKDIVVDQLQLFRTLVMHFGYLY